MDNQVQEGEVVASHFACAGECGGVSKEAGGVCQAPDCSCVGQELKACGCESPEHNA